MANMDWRKLSEKLPVFFLFFFGLALVFWPVLSGENLFNDSYVTNYAVGQTGYNFYKDFGSSLRQGNLQLWLSSYMGGFPVYLTQAGFFNPIGILLFSFFDYILAYNWLIFLNFLLACLAMYWFMRSLKLSMPAAVLAGFAWALSFNNIEHGSIPIFSNLYPFIPLFFGAILKISEGDKRYLFFGGLISAFGLISGFTNIVFYTFIVGLAWALFLDKKRFSTFHFGKAFRGYVIIYAIGVILASIWLLPVMDYMSLTIRGQAVSSSNFYDYLKVGDILRFFYPFIQLPGFSGFTILSGVTSLYIGIIPFFLAIVAFLSWRKNRIAAFWLALFVFAFSMRLWFFPIFQWTQYLPLFNRFRAPFHWYSLAFFSLAVLGAYGLDYIKEIKNSRCFGIFVKTLGIFASLNILAALIVNLAVKFFRTDILDAVFKYANPFLSRKQYPVSYYHEIITQVFDRSAATFLFSNYHFLISFSFVLMGAALFIVYHYNLINLEKFKILAVAVTIFNLFLIWQGYYNFTPKKLITIPPNTIQFIQNQTNTSIQRCIEVNCQFRVFRFYPPEMYKEFGFYNVKNYLDYDMKTLGLQINPYWVDGFGGGEPFRSRRISEIIDEIGYEVSATYSKPSWIKSNELSLSQKISRFSSPQNLNLLSMLNIKYIFSSFKLNNLKLVYETTATEKNIPVYIYENPSAMPRIYFAKNVKYINSENAFEELLKVKDFHDITLIECDKDCPTELLIYEINSSGLNISRFEPQEVKTKTKTNQGQWLIYSDANLPTWEATIDNQKTPIYTANYLFKSVFVPKGEHEVVFKYPNLWEQFKYAFKNIF